MDNSLNQITYEKLGEKYECMQIKSTSSSELLITIGEPLNGMLKLGGVSLKMKNGAAKVEISGLESGIMMPMLFTSEGAFQLEGFLVKDGVIFRLDPSGDYIRTLSKRCEELAERVISLEEKVSKITEKIEKTTIF